MDHETGDLPHRPEGNATSALESAAAHLRAVPRPIGSHAARDREILRGRQTRDLLAWAREIGRLVPSADYASVAIRGGEEHRVWLGAKDGRVWKATYPGQTGFTAICGLETGGAVELARATPLEYLERLQQQNRIFGDAVLLEGIAEESQGPVIISSQPFVPGDAVEAEAFSEFMRGLWFAPLPGLQLGNPGSLAFYRDLDEVAAFDAHPANFVKDANGVVLPIDLILVTCDESLQRALAAFLPRQS